MKMLKLVSAALIFLVNHAISAQNGAQICFQVFGSDSITVQPFTRIVMISKDSVVFSTLSDLTGRAIFDSVEEGEYSLTIKTLTYKPVIDTIEVYDDSIVELLIYFRDEVPFFACGPIRYYEPPNFMPDFGELSISRFDQVINGLGLRSVQKFDETLAKSKIDETAIFMVDGIRYENLNSLPLYRIKSVKQCINGLPAKYGDTMSEVYSITTKSYFDYYYEWKASQ